MLTGVDRVQIVVANRHAVAAAFARLLDAAPTRQDAVRCLGAQRTVLALGTSSVELLEPDGSGVVADFLASGRGGLFAAGFSTADVRRLRSHLERHDVPLAAEGDQLFLSPDDIGVPGLRAVISPQAERPSVGLARHLYEATLLAHEFAPVAQRIAVVFGLDNSCFTSIRSAEFGYDGTLTLFHPDRLDRVEVITPHDPAKTMGRFFTRRGPSLYMCFAEADDLAAVRERLREHAPLDWSGPLDDSLFIHPPALGGVMLGISRTTFAWSWSGHPERVVATA